MGLLIFRITAPVAFTCLWVSRSYLAAPNPYHGGWIMDFSLLLDILLGLVPYHVSSIHLTLGKSHAGYVFMFISCLDIVVVAHPSLITYDFLPSDRYYMFFLYFPTLSLDRLQSQMCPHGFTNLWPLLFPVSIALFPILNFCLGRLPAVVGPIFFAGNLSLEGLSQIKIGKAGRSLIPIMFWCVPLRAMHYWVWFCGLGYWVL